MTLEGRVALVTGAAGEGMGRSIALTLARDGADIAINFRRSEKRAQATCDDVRALGRRAVALQADLSSPEECERLVQGARDALGRLDVVIASAGGPWKPQDVTEIGGNHLRRVLALEVESVYAMLRAALPGMRAQGWGRVVLVGGHGADDWRFGPPEAPLDYPLGKAARHWIARALGPRELPHGITINAVAPGPTRRFTREEALAGLRGEVEGGDGNTPQDVAETVTWLCSGAASRISGAVIPIPGARPV
jgi:3-oxoacyl-[acyl-carrier protein] reductase